MYTYALEIVDVSVIRCVRLYLSSAIKIQCSCCIYSRAYFCVQQLHIRMDTNAGFYAAFKDFLQSSVPKPADKKISSVYETVPVGNSKNINREEKNTGNGESVNDHSVERDTKEFDINGTCNTEPASPSDSMYDSDLSNSGVTHPVYSSKSNKSGSSGNLVTAGKASCPEDKLVNCGNASSLQKSADNSVDEKVMKGAIYINGNIEHNSSLENALASVVQEFEISSSNDDSCESNSYEAIFVPLKNIAPYPALSSSLLPFPGKDAPKQGLSNGCEIKANRRMADYNKSNCKEMLKCSNASSDAIEVVRKSGTARGSSPNKENYHCNMQSVLCPPVSVEEPRVVVEIAPASDILCLGDISALKNIDDGDIERELGSKEDTNLVDSHSQHNSDAVDYDDYSSETWNKDDFEDFELVGGYTRKNSLDCLKKTSSQDLNIIVEKGSGERLEDIPRIALEVLEAPHEIIPTFHSVLYDITGCCKNKTSRSLTKRNILRFNGFPFDENSVEFETKKNHLSKMPMQILSDICYIILGTQVGNKAEMVDKMLQFLLKPHNNLESDMEIRKRMNKKNNLLNMDKDMRQMMMCEQARKCKVVLERLNEEDIQRKINQVCKGKFSVSSSSSPRKLAVGYVKPDFIHIGPGQPLKSFSEVVKNINNASERVIHLFHVLMYGIAAEKEEVKKLLLLWDQQIKETEKSKKHILEFSGFPVSQSEWSDRRTRFMHMLTPHDLRNMCRALNMCPRERSKPALVSLLLEFLQKPSQQFMKRSSASQQPHLVCSSQPVVEECISGKQHQSFESSSSQQPPPNSSSQSPREICISSKPLKSFENIRSSIECATPEDLQELHDVIFSQSCESYQIHKKILDFRGFPFDENSQEFQSRKTLMYYMSFSGIKKIASLLDLPCLGVLNCYRQDLTDTILKFLLKPSSYTKDFSPALSPSEDNSRSNEHSGHYLQETQHTDESRHSELNITLRPYSASSPHSVDKKRSFDHDDQRNMCNALVPATNLAVSHQFPSRKKYKPDLSSSSEEESDHTLPLAAFISHPSDNDLKQVIHEIIEGSVHSITMTGLVQAVYEKYPEYDLKYRSHFIKKTARKVLSKMSLLNCDAAIASSQSERPAAISFTYNGQISYNHGRFSAVSSVVKAGNALHNTSDCVVSTTVINERMPPTLESNDETYLGSEFRNYPKNPCIVYTS